MHCLVLDKCRRLCKAYLFLNQVIINMSIVAIFQKNTLNYERIKTIQSYWETLIGLLFFRNRYIITWMLRQINMHLIKWYSQLTKIPISPPPIQSVYLTPFFPARWTSWPINEVYISNLNCRQFPPINLYSLSLFLKYK